MEAIRAKVALAFEQASVADVPKARKMTEEHLRYIKALCRQIVAEHDEHVFARLVSELDQLLETRQYQPEYEKIVDAAVDLMRSDYASMQMLFPERGTGGELLLLAFRGFNPHAAEFWQWVRADSRSTCGVALRANQRVVAADIANCGFMADSEDRQVYLDTGIRACQTTPLIARAGKVVGMISTHWRKPHQPSDEDFRQFDTLARQAADLIELCRQ